MVFIISKAYGKTVRLAYWDEPSRGDTPEPSRGDTPN